MLPGHTFKGMRRVLSSTALAGLLAAFLLPSPAVGSVTAVPGSVSPVLNSTSGNPNFSTAAVAAGWAPTASITVSYKLYERDTSTHPWVKVEGYASGAGGPAENNGASKTRFVGVS